MLAVLMCLTLYRWDNKYTRPGSQPISGVLILSQEDVEQTPLRYLVREWTFYSGDLLTPAEVSAHSGYRRYVSIGEISTLEASSGHGCGTYRLTLLLPEEPGNYALELPEVFSSCRLYVNEKQLLALGDPEQGRPGIASRVVTFTAAGRTELLLAVQDNSSIYNGMTYPPAFGTAQAVLNARELRLLLHGAGVLLALLGGALSACFGILGNRRRGILLMLSSLCCIVIIGYPLLHGLCVTGFQPWYTMELSALYAFLLLAVLLQCDLFGLWGRTALYLSLPCGVGLAAAILRSGCAAVLSPAAGAVFSMLSTGIKYYTVACLVGLSLRALRQNRHFSAPLLYASAVLGACLVMDRLLPLYEPVYGGWFEELGAVSMAAALTAALWLDAMDAYRFRLSYAERYQQMEHQVTYQKEHYWQLTRQIELAHQSSHDLRHHMRILHSMAQQGQTQQILNYLTEYEGHAANREVITFSENPVADAILTHYAAICRTEDTVCELHLTLPPKMTIPDVEMCILLGNLLENAVEALAHQTQGPRRLYLRGDAVDGRLGLVVENSFSGALQARGDAFLSTKHAGLGVGVRAVRTIVEKYGGLADFSADGSTFRAQLMLPLPKKGMDLT